MNVMHLLHYETEASAYSAIRVVSSHSSSFLRATLLFFMLGNHVCYSKVASRLVTAGSRSAGWRAGRPAGRPASRRHNSAAGEAAAAAVTTSETLTHVYCSIIF